MDAPSPRRPRVSAITLGVRDVAASRRVYVEGLGWAPLFEEAGEILFVQVAAGQVLAPLEVDDDGAVRLGAVGEA